MSGVTTAAAARQARNRAALRSGTGTIVSRVTGLIRLLMVAYALGGGRLADAFNLANSTPNIVHDLVLGGVLGATFVPVFVERLAHAPRLEAIESISAVVSLGAVVLLGATLLFELGAPEIIDLYTFHTATTGSSALEQHVAVELLRYFAPQLACYGAISLMGAVLATDGRFVAVGFVPVLNNVVGIVVLGAFAGVVHSDSVAKLSSDHLALALLGLGTTAGVAVQALALVPSMRRAGLHLRFVWRPSDQAVRTILRLAGWTFGFVVANQVAVFVVLALEYHLPAGGVSAYTYAYTFFQMPFGVAATAIVAVATPDLARSYAANELQRLGRRFGVALRQLLAVILPSMVVYLVLAKPAIALILQHGEESSHAASLTAAVLVLFSLGLPGYCVFFLAIRTFQTMQDTRTAFLCYVVENGLNIAIALVVYHRLGIQGLALSYSIAYTVAAIVTLMVLRQRLGTIGGRQLLAATTRSLWLAVLMAFVLAFVTTLTGTGGGLSGWVKLGLATVVGGAVYLGGAGLAGTLTALSRARRRGTATRGTVDVAHRRRY